MESQKSNEVQEGLTKQFLTLDKVNRHKFLEYLVTMPDLEEKKEIEDFLDNMYLGNIDDGEKMAEELLKMTLTLEKDQRITFVEYLTGQLSDEDSAFVFRLIGSNKTDENIVEDIELEENQEKPDSYSNKIVDNSEIHLNADISEIDHNSALNIVDPKQNCLEEDSNQFQNGFVYENNFVSELKNLTNQFFKLDQVNRHNFLRYLVTVPDLVDKKDIESFLDGVYLDKNDAGEKIAEDLLKMVLNLEKENKSTFVKHLTSQLNDEDIAYVFSFLGNLKEDKNLDEDMELEENEERIDLQLNQVVDDNETDLQVIKKETLNPVHENYFENDTLLIKIAPRLLTEVNIKSEFEKETYLKNERKINKKVGSNNPNIPTKDSFEHKITIKNYKREKIDTNADKHLSDEHGINIKSEKIWDVNKVKIEEDSKYFENDILLIKVRIKDKIGTKSNVGHTKNNIDVESNTTGNYEHKNDTQSDCENQFTSNNSKNTDNTFYNKDDNVEELYVNEKDKNNIITKGKPQKQRKQRRRNKDEINSKIIPKELLKPSRESIFKCKHCSIGTKTKQQLQQHKCESIFKCEHCSIGTVTEQQLQQHITVSHKNDNEVESNSTICDICSKQFGAPSRLKYHRLSHSKERPFLCDKCSKTYKTSTHLKEHKHIFHNGGSKRNADEVSQVCEHCSKILKTPDILRQHIKLSHIEKYAFKCDKCDKSFNRKLSLESHSFIHKESKDFICDQCSKSFRSPYTLKQHKMVHGGKTYTCGQCNKNFFQLGNFKAHERVHNEEKPYICDVCQKGFVQKVNLKSHKVKCMIAARI